jgi:hypothetical protein
VHVAGLGGCGVLTWRRNGGRGCCLQMLGGLLLGCSVSNAGYQMHLAGSACLCLKGQSWLTHFVGQDQPC